MLSVKLDGFIFYLVHYSMWVCLNGQLYCQDSCKMSKLLAPLGSSVVLPCSFGNATQSSLPNLYWVSWVQNLSSALVNLTSAGRVQFMDPRFGRVKAFPIQSFEGNFSIRIDALQDTDLGCYCCEQAAECYQVQVEKDATSKHMMLLVYITVGLAFLILLLSICSYYCVKWFQNKSSPEHVSDPGANSDPQIYENNDPARRHEAAPYNHDLTVYVNARNVPTQSGNGHDLTSAQCNVAKTENQTTRPCFHKDLLRRLRQTSLRQHYYANQADNYPQTSTSQKGDEARVSFPKRKVKQKSDLRYGNPIYNNSRDNLNLNDAC
ncbi:uncharacterized protein LOC130116104 isoform X2 [Lampris incognitus]|uniref:uncharacterized protein LOC130116104 isoform X2 n=1 Tax=Lampris incognitus TaxID=2546036 RepID=UPI0024B510B1|nr:uncharacterized protein LOC130116104 isoform X2 [Lampris incognitus]